jgi:hypothetical protein
MVVLNGDGPPRGVPGRDARASARPGIGPRLELGQQVQHARAALRRVVRADLQLGDALEAQAPAQLVADVARGPLERLHGCVPIGRLADHADPDPGMPQVG